MNQNSYDQIFITMKNENQETLKKMPVPYQALRYDLDALRAWTEIISLYLNKDNLTRAKVKTATFVCLSVSASLRKETDTGNYYLYRAAIGANESGMDLIKLIGGVSNFLNEK